MGKRLRYYVTETLLWLLAGAGLIAILLVIAAYTFNTSVILFRTGSMEPTVPTGSAALVREIPASEVEVGDILTIERPNQLPVTHRVIAVEPGDTPDERIIDMQGDANDSPDASPYKITEGKVMLGSVPGMANVVNQLGSPYVLGSITIAAAILVGWAFWPQTDIPTQSKKLKEKPSSSHEHGHSSPSSYRQHSWASIGIMSALLTVIPYSMPSDHGKIVEETIESQYITLTSVFDPGTRTALTPVNSSIWDIGIEVEAPSDGQGRIGIQAQGDLPIQISVLMCSTRWTDQPNAVAENSISCSGTNQSVVKDLRVSSESGLQWIADFEATNAPWLRLIVSLPSDATNQMESESTLRVDVEAVGDKVSTDTAVAPAEASPEPSLRREGLANTGLSVLFLVLVALASMTLGRWFYTRRSQKAHK